MVRVRGHLRKVGKKRVRVKPHSINLESRFQKELTHIRRLAVALFIAVGLILFWRGIWEGSVGYLTPTQAIAIGLGILIVSGVATRIFTLGTKW